jgi:uncharacterized protein
MNKVVHFEIPADDIARAKIFYGETFGWELEDVPDIAYTVAKTAPINEPGAINGGIVKRTDISKRPVLYVSVSDVDEALRKVEENGGEIAFPKKDVPGMGAYAQIADSEGNIIGLWEMKDK